jgi:hypothetical protein
MAQHRNDILDDRQSDVLTEIKVEREAPEFLKDHGTDGCSTSQSQARIIFTGIGECA